MTDLLNTLNRAQLAALYNTHADAPLGLASTKPAAVERVVKLAEKLGLVAESVEGAVMLVKPAPAAPQPAAAPAGSAKAPVHGLAARRGPQPTFGDDAVITVLAKSNPKRAGSESYARFALYRTGMTVGEYLAAAHKLHKGTSLGRWRADLSFDTERDYIKVEAKQGR